MSGALEDKAKALGTQDFSQLLVPFAPHGEPIAVAVSGGPDSMALAYLLKRWGQKDLVALIVDHALREDSSKEAVETQKRLAQLGIRSEILTWTHGAIDAKIHEKARQARYDLLLQACARLKIKDLYLAHHKDDQAETILMRLSKGSSLEGLRGMRSLAVRENVRLLRPFLSISKETLLATCKENDLSYITDPTNASSRFARGRLRAILPLLAQEGLSIENILRLGAQAQDICDVLEESVHRFLLKAARSEIGGSIQLDLASLKKASRAIALRAISACLRYVHSDTYAPEQDGLYLLYEDLLKGSDAKNRTFYGTLASLGEGHVTFLRESAAIRDIRSMAGKQTLLWDNRWLITSHDPSLKGEIKALGLITHEETDRLAPNLRRSIPQGRIRATLPSLWYEGRLVAIPSFEENDVFHMVFQKGAFPPPHEIA